MRRLFTALALVVLPVTAACGGDAATTSVEAAIANPASSSPVSSLAPSVSESLLIDSLPELTGPTVLWFWAPG